VTGSPFGDEIVGSLRADHISALGGSDVVRAAGGDDRIWADTARLRGGGDDLVVAGDGHDTVDSTGGNDHVVGGPGDDFLADLGHGPDVLQGGEGNDVVLDQLTTEAGERLAGGPGRDRVDLFSSLVNPAPVPGTASMDLASGVVRFDAGDPSTLSATGFERLELATYGFVWTVTGTSARDRVGASGSAGTTFRGRGGDDLFLGSASDDSFFGGPGTDRNLGMGIGTNHCESVEVDDDGTCSP
jgi:Ca2+-binding RTX toxin-like protein